MLIFIRLGDLEPSELNFADRAFILEFTLFNPAAGTSFLRQPHFPVVQNTTTVNFGSKLIVTNKMLKRAKQ